MASVVTSTGLAHYHEKMKTLLNDKANTSHTHNYAGAFSSGGGAKQLANFNNTTRVTSANLDLTNTYNNAVSYMMATSVMKTGKPPSDGHILTFGWDTNMGWGSQLALGDGKENAHLYLRGADGVSDGASYKTVWADGWNTVLDSYNYTNYAAAKSHTHDDRYYTKATVDKKSEYISTCSYTENTGKTVYIKLFTVQLTGQYSNFVYEFALTNRSNGPAYIVLYIESSNANKASAIKLTYRGLTNISDNIKAYHYINSTTKYSYVEVWYKVAAWDEIRLFRKTLTDRTGTITFESKLTPATSFPTNAEAVIDCTRATFYANLDWAYVTNKPSTYPPQAHTHDTMTNAEIDALF